MPPATSRIISLSRKVKRAGWKYPLTANDEHALLAGCYYDSALAHKPIDWIECFCRLSDGPRAGQRIELADWQAKALQAIFGWQRPDGTRRYRKVYITIAKKNFKSTFCGCLALYGLEADGEQGAYIYLAAVDSDQTDQVFHPAAEMVRRSPALAKRYKVIESQQTIRHGTNAWIQSLASDSGSSEGLNAHFMIIDELHAWKNQEFYDSLEYASIARRQPLELVITTRGSDPNGICGTHEDRFKKIANDEIIDISHLPLIFAPDDDDDLMLESTWRKANPALGSVLSVDDFASALSKAKNGSPAQWANFVRRRLNMWRRGDTPYFDVNRWEALARSISDKELRDAPCWAAIDLSFKDDFTAIGLVFLLEDKSYHVKTYFFIPEKTIESKDEKGEGLYRIWKRGSHLTATKGFIIDQRQVIEHLDHLSTLYNVKNQPVAFDRWGAQIVMTELEELGFEVFQFGQGFKSMSEPTKEFSNSILDARISHDGNPVMNWMMGNAVAVEDPAGNVKLVKASGTGKKRQKYKIDGPVCIVMAMHSAMNFRTGLFRDSDTPIYVMK